MAFRSASAPDTLASEGVALAVTEEMLSTLLAGADFCPLRLLLHPEPQGLAWGVGGKLHAILAVKRHWRFLLDQIFHYTPALAAYDREIVLLEEDHRPTPDLMLTLPALIRLKNDGDKCTACWAIFLKWGCMREDQEEDINKACRVKWFTNTGVAFNRTIFNQIEKSTFDEFRDGWDWSMYHIIQTQQLLPCQPDCVPHMVAPAVARISNIGTHGVTVKEEDAASLEQLKFHTVSEDAVEKGFDGSKVYLAEYFGHAGATDDFLFLGFEDQHLKPR